MKFNFAAVAVSAFLSVCFHSNAIADARLNAPTAAGTRVNSDSESLLRYGLPIKSKEVRELQSAVELIKADLKTRRNAFAKIDLNNAKSLLKKYEQVFVKTAPPSSKGLVEESIGRMQQLITPLGDYIVSESDSGSGSVQERDFLDKAFNYQNKLSRELTQFEELFVPPSFSRSIPEEYRNLPRLNGRAEVDIVLKKPDNSPYNVDGKLYDQAELKLVLDGYNAPITAGNIVDLINNGFYDKRPITRSDGFVVQIGDPNPGDTSDAVPHGYVPPGSKQERKIPLEIALKDDPDILYGSTSEDDGRGYAAAVLPFQAVGALGMARSEFEANSASSQFFFLLFDSDLTPAGKNMLDGRYTCFGYTVDGGDFLKDVKEGDLISSIRVVKGAENLVKPQQR